MYRLSESYVVHYAVCVWVHVLQPKGCIAGLGPAVVVDNVRIQPVGLSGVAQRAEFMFIVDCRL